MKGTRENKELEYAIVSHVYCPVEPPKTGNANNVPYEDVEAVCEAINSRLDRVDKRLEELSNFKR